MPVSQDAYSSFRGSQRRDFGEPTSAQPVVFVDLDTDDVELLRSLPPTFIGQQQGTLIIRLPDTDPDDWKVQAIRELLVERWGLLPRTGILRQRLGEEAAVDMLRAEPLGAAERVDI